MTPILFEKTATDFSGLGYARLPDAISCTVTEELNGEYELELVYPVTGQNFLEIEEDMILAVIPAVGATRQAFRIYRITTPIDGNVTINARHISYQLGYIPICDTTSFTTPAIGYVSGTVTGVLNALAAKALVTCPFSFYSDIPGQSASFAFGEPMSFRACIQEIVEHRLGHTYENDIEWDNWTVRILQRRGADNGVRITYGQNLTDITRTVDMGDLVTGVVPFYYPSEETGGVLSSPVVVNSSTAGDYAHLRVVPLDMTAELEEKPTAAELKQYGEQFLANSSSAQIIEAIEVNFVDLSQTTEYAEYADLEQVNLGDTVHVSYPKLGISVAKRVSKTIYNVLLNRYDEIELGGEPDVADTIADLSTEMADGGGQSLFNTIAPGTITKNDNSATLATTNRIDSDGHIAILCVGAQRSGGSYPANTYTLIETVSPPPKSTQATVITGQNGTAAYLGVNTSGQVQIYPYGATFNGWARGVFTYFL